MRASAPSLKDEDRQMQTAAPKGGRVSCFIAVRQSIALKANSPPSLMPENQRAVTVLVLV